MTDKRVVLYGGNGFVGTSIAKLLVQRGVTPVIISRTGDRPAHLTDESWADDAVWLYGDAKRPTLKYLKGATAVVALVGSAPVPTFSDEAYKHRFFKNSLPNIGAIAAAKATGVKHLVLIGAHIPKVLSTRNSAYVRGKRLCIEAASDFAATSDLHGAVILQPTGIYGVRHKADGKAVRLDLVLRPISIIQGVLPEFIRKFLPEQLVSVEAVARAAVSACLDEAFAGKHHVLSNQEIIADYDEISSG